MTEETGHSYLSTGCWHGNLALPDGRTGHEYCQGETGALGAKTPAQCKFCGAPCICPCHHAAAPGGTEDSCRVVEVDGGPIRIHGQGELTDEGKAALASVVATAKKLMATLPPGPLEFECPRCSAVPGQLCRREFGMIGGRAPHDERRALARAAVAGPATGSEEQR